MMLMKDQESFYIVIRYTISNTFSNVFNNPKIYSEKFPKRQKDEIRLLTVCTYYPHKDLEIIPKILII